jgi:FkbM family methyltransferase
MFIEHINNVKNKKQVLLDEMSSSSIPNILYGVGSYATDIKRFLEINKIKIECSCVDGLYFHNNMNFQGLEVYSLETLEKRYSSFNIIIGFSNHLKARENLTIYKNIRNIYFLDVPNHINFFDYQFIEENLREFEKTFNLLQDEQSKDTMVAYVNSKISGGANEALINVYDDCQYFNNIIPFGNNEVFVDCGSYTGDTILAFNKKVNGCYNKIYAFEPDDYNYAKLMETIIANKLRNVEVVKKGCWSREAELSFTSDRGMSSVDIDNIFNNNKINVTSIDNVVDIENVSFIKMDIEGAELEALKGASETLKRSKPNLAICVYHKPEDLITIPKYILEIVPEYKFYLRHHQYITWETVLYAVIR